MSWHDRVLAANAFNSSLGVSFIYLPFYPQGWRAEESKGEGHLQGRAAEELQQDDCGQWISLNWTECYPGDKIWLPRTSP